MKKITHGGKRPGAGGPKKEETVIKTFRFKKSFADKLYKQPNPTAFVIAAVNEKLEKEDCNG